MKTILSKSLFFLLLITCNTIATSQLKVSKLFSDHTVLQRDQPIHIWGWQTPGKNVKVTFNGVKRSFKTKLNGQWEVTFPKMKADGKKYEIAITSGKETIILSDIILGDVWLCSGQSNMEWPLMATNNADEEINNCNDNLIRHFKLPNSYANSPEDELAGGTWELATPKNVGNFTAVGYYFAKNIRNEENIPVGLLNSSWGGSRVEPWMNAQTLGLKDPENFLMEIQKEEEEKLVKKMKKIKASFPNISLRTETFKNDNDLFAKKEIDVADWPTLKVPLLWEEQGYEGFDGVVWYRTTFELTAKEASEGITLHLAMIDDSDITWVNGNYIDETINKYNAKRIYEVDPEYLNAGKNNIAIRVDDTGGGGGIYGDPADLYIRTVKKNISLAKDWKFYIEAYRRSYMGKNQVPTILYNKMIYPLLRFPIKGVIWYQGESNADTKEDAYAYRNLFPKMIEQWRNDWGIGSFPFLFVQLANFKEAKQQPEDSNWALLRESQTEALKLPNTAQAVIIDIGDANDIHPRNKKDVGYRLALGAEKLAYGKEITSSGPTFKEYAVDSNKVTISFDHVSSGLVTKNKYGYVNGYAIAGEGQKFYWAKGAIKDNKVVIWSDKVPQPKYVRYAWADNPDDVNLYNAEGLPAAPFRFTIEK